MAARASDTASRPNILVILVDDMGYSDIGCYGSEIRTPNIDRLARGGIRFTQAYNCARCCPTRASLLTGLYPHQAGVGRMVGNVGPRSYQGYLRSDAVTVAEVLKSAGYRTYMSGKWHVGGEYSMADPEAWKKAGDPTHPMPNQRGFDRFYGTPTGAGNYFEPECLFEDGRYIPPADQPDDYYYTDAISEKAADYVRDASESGDPFFLYVAHTAPHWPLQARPEDIERYEGKYLQGWDKLRKARNEEQKGMGLLDARWPISPRDEEAPAWEDVERKEWQAHRMAVYAAMVDRMDQGIGTVLQALEDTGQLDNTLILFLSDNGGCAEFLNEDGNPKGWPQFYGKTLRDGRKVKVGNAPGRRAGPADTFMSYDLPWANASDTPFRKFKAWTHEGGISTPLVAHWPNGIPAPAIRHEPVHVVDFMATFTDLADAGYPGEFNGEPIQPMEGESFRPVLEGKLWQRNSPIFFEHEGRRAVRLGDWKLLGDYRAFGDSPGYKPWELYHMVEDRVELNDRASGEQDRMQQMAGLYRDWSHRVETFEYEGGFQDSDNRFRLKWR